MAFQARLSFPPTDPHACLVSRPRRGLLPRDGIPPAQVAHVVETPIECVEAAGRFPIEAGKRSSVVVLTQQRSSPPRLEFQRIDFSWQAPKPLSRCQAAGASTRPRRATTSSIRRFVYFTPSGSRADAVAVDPNGNRGTAYLGKGRGAPPPSFTGSSISTSNPGFAFLARIDPLCSSMARRAMDSPRPIPPLARSRSDSTR